jgi:hypothetical protein
LEDQAAEIESLKEQLKWAQAKIAAMQLDLDRWAQKNQEWAKEKVRQMSGQQEYPRAQGWKKYLEQQSQSDHLSDLSREAERQEAERNRWLE